MIKLATFETFIVDVPTIRPHVLSVATMRAQSIVIVRLRASDGVEGIGEASTIGGLSYGPESPESIKLTLDTYMRPILEGCDLAQVGATMAAISKRVVGNHFAKCALETALLDAKGKRLGVSVSELLGGGRLRERLPVAWTLASGKTATDIAEAEAMLDARRHNIFKLKIGKRSVDEDVAHVAAIKAALGNEVSLRVDVNQGWSETDADRGMAGLLEAGCDLVEQPVRGHAHAAMKRLSARHSLPIMADESLQGPEDGFALAMQSSARVFAIKIAQAGGLLAAQELCAIAKAAGIELYGGTMLEGGVGTVASAHLCATLSDLAWGTELFGPLLLTEEILETPLDYSDFSLGVPNGPGLGIALDAEKIDRFRRDGSTARRIHAV
ncbi:muconate cycloisomerase [Thioclava dalianensis]|uniref:Muconate cycloisomerase n=1 Tax=Thioclava dalianensis TaxID=1185766 RepID=A0A074TQZ7_9RHOB|nr:muconate/chloromuconate family cycloisomerase [Thioclava dalianensis]KEP71388.1 muconate cycloisomerase [Thioclava dalianensis]SFM78834.1 muconate cycloisomerase [Thioclava dalianensis]